MSEKHIRNLTKNRLAKRADTVSRKVKLAVLTALREHAKNSVPAIVHARDDGIIYELHADGSRIPIAEKKEPHYSEKFN